jgi:hypothetical protein
MLHPTTLRRIMTPCLQDRRPGGDGEIPPPAQFAEDLAGGVFGHEEVRVNSCFEPGVCCSLANSASAEVSEPVMAVPIQPMRGERNANKVSFRASRCRWMQSGGRNS